MQGEQAGSDAAAVRERAAELQRRLEAVRQRVAQIEQRLEPERQRLAERERRLDPARQHVAELERRLEETRCQAEVLQQRHARATEAARGADNGHPAIDDLPLALPVGLCI